MNTENQSINEYIKKKYSKKISSSETVTIDDRDHYFVRQVIPGFPVTMVMPADVVELDAHLARVKYPSENRPDLILTLPEDETVNFLFSRPQGEMATMEIPDTLQSFQTVLKRMHPGLRTPESGMIQTGISTAGWFDYTSAALDEDIYNIMYLLSLNGKMLLCGFCCLQRQAPEWQPVVLQMIGTMRYLGVDRDEL